MDKQQANSGSNDAGLPEDSDQMLPAVQAQNNNGAEDPSPTGEDQTVPTSRALVTTPEEASDSDLIEKEWVLKAKQIVEHTSEDPYVQQQELNKMKADYMKKRYNKDIGSA